MGGQMPDDSDVDDVARVGPCRQAASWSSSATDGR